ncbi:hypothetical protein [Lachnotalea glycerini]|uniref:Uncharacterized protein n=1 Tax=Lachnotalea glycerini TaxID=1763509 RepID=A0A371JDJ6_9FIRM|nr:hypothetical protein [Lachnotalea glycerini]RDY30795.1 hypothetical protein CG710_012910 [Lachnotalea glycerini]
MRPDEKLVEKKQRSDLKEKLPQIVDKKSVQSMDGQWTAEYSVVENSIEKYSIEECKATLEKEKLTQKEYNELLQKYNKDLVDDVIQRIIEHPYVNCLNVPVIEKWFIESGKRIKPTSSNKKNSFNNCMQRNYNYVELERELLSLSNPEVKGERWKDNVS